MLNDNLYSGLDF